MPKQQNAVTVEKQTIKYDRTAEIKEMFNLFDKDKSGSISKQEVASLLTSLGRNSDEKEVQKLISECDKNNSGTIELQEFIDYVDKTYVVSTDNILEVVDAFKIFDLDGNGWISLEEFKHILMNFGGEFTEDECEHIFRESDSKGDGQLTYAEFVEIWKYQ